MSMRTGGTQTVTMLLAGGMGSRLNILGQARAKPAIPFGGMYRIIDFTLSNVMNSGLDNVGILTQYKPLSLMAHIGTGAAWDFIGPDRSARILPPQKGHTDHDWYRGTADAVTQNWEYIEGYDPDMVLILSGDHIYSMDYSKMLRHHQVVGAELSLAVMPIDPSECRHFGMVHVNPDGTVARFEEKPVKTDTLLANMGIYVFSADVLGEELHSGAKDREDLDFGKHVIPGMLGRRRVHTYRFEGYWRDVGTIKAYWDAHMDMLEPTSGLDLSKWEVFTNPTDRAHQDRPPSRLLAHASVKGSVVSRGCFIEGTVEDSVLAPGVHVERGAVVRKSIVLHDTRVGPGAVVDYAIIDKDVVVGANARVGVGDHTRPNEKHPDHLDCGIVLIGKGVQLPDGVELGRNCIVRPGVRASDFTAKHVPAGATIDTRSR